MYCINTSSPFFFLDSHWNNLQAFVAFGRLVLQIWYENIIIGNKIDLWLELSL